MGLYIYVSDFQLLLRPTLMPSTCEWIIGVRSVGSRSTARSGLSRVSICVFEMSADCPQIHKTAATKETCSDMPEGARWSTGRAVSCGTRVVGGRRGSDSAGAWLAGR